MKYLFIILVTVFSLETYCQDSTSVLKNQIYPKTFSGWWMDGKKIKFKQFKNEIYKVPAATLYYKKSVKQQVYFYVGAAAVTSYFFISKANQKNFPYQRNSFALDMAGIATSAVTTFFFIASNRNLKKAVQIHNEKRALSY